jgi:hypothetical protein
MIEAAILLKPVFSVLTPEFAGTQEGTLHFHYLLPENGGFLRVASSIDEHVTQLQTVLDTPDSVRDQTERFVKSFLRPNGLSVSCTPVLAGEIERAAIVGQRARESDAVTTRALRILLQPVAALVKWLHLGEDLLALARRKAHGIWLRLGRNTRVGIKRLVLRPARLVVWAIGVTVKRGRRLFRFARHRVVVRLRGVTLGVKGTDGNG